MPTRLPSRRRGLGLAALVVVLGAPFAVLDSSAADPGTPAANPSPSPSTGTGTGGSDALGGVLGGALVQAQQLAQQQQHAGPVTPAADGQPPTSYPGLPPLTGYQWDGVGASGLTEVRRSQQYLRMPPVALAADVGVQVIDPPPDGFLSAINSTIGAYVVSPPGAEHPYGDFPPLRARLLAFGALPVEATVHISQLRDAHDLPVPLQGGQIGAFDPNFFQRLSDASLSGEVQLRVSDLTVDGVGVDVGTSCRTVAPSSLALVGTGYWSDGGDLFWTLASSVPTPETTLTADQVKQDYYSVTNGGLLHGTIDVPAFTGCVGPSGDLSRLVSSAVSAPAQPLLIRQSTTFQCFPPQLVTGCEVPDPFPYPTSP